MRKALVAAAAWIVCGAAVETPRQIVCKVETAENTSLRQQLSVPPEPILHNMKDLSLDGEAYVRTETLRGGDLDAEVHHEIDRRTGRFVATRLEIRHDIGEQHDIKLTGMCVRLNDGAKR